jgi:hypothetical protein
MDTFANRGNFRALEVDLPIETHEELHGLQLRIPGGDLNAALYVFICQVLDRVAQNLQRMPSLWSDPAAAIAPNLGV